VDLKEHQQFNCPIGVTLNDMKNIITTLAIIAITFSSLMATTTPEVLISNKDVKVVTVGHLAIFASSEYVESSETLVFNTNDDIAAVQVFDGEGNMMFVLPVLSDNVQIKKNMFETGNYRLGFILKGESTIHLTDVIIKQ